MANARILSSALSALGHRHMASFSPRVVLSCALLVGLFSGCASSKTAHPGEGDTLAPSPDPTAPKTPEPPEAGTTVTAKDLDDAGSDPIEKALASRVPGVSITRTPDGSLAIRIRGQTSINANAEPLYVIDGLPVQPGPGGSLVGINPHDIASIEVIKDAQSLSFYGVRAANGVILIKTKHSN
jgi:TonB-dependent SusC/RagA subfamily outer membrane receptor